jgi:hypothetical protein
MAARHSKSTEVIRKDAGKQARIANDNNSFLSQTLAWEFGRRDQDHEKFGWSGLDGKQMLELINVHLVNLESMTWSELLKASGGKKTGHGNNHHDIPVTQLSHEAQKRLMELCLDDIDSLFSLRITGTKRIFGIRDGRVLRFLWHDPSHAVCQAGK